MGFEDTPDYDYLRELFTQALKNTGEVEDGEYDWMKLNNGKGWEAMKHHPSQHLHAPNAGANQTTRAIAGGVDTPRGTGTPGLSALRLKEVQPPPPTSAKPGVGKTRDRPGVSGAQPLKRQSGAAGGLNDVTPAVSTQGQFLSSTANLPQRMSQANPGMNQTTVTQQQSRAQNPEPQPSAFQKFMKVLCCSR